MDLSGLRQGALLEYEEAGASPQALLIAAGGLLLMALAGRVRPPAG
ncbi:MAG: hypothetical protein Q8P31_05100 [Bacillota bacterium]|nr:hypothetical protein [Bacillota bacterium]